MYSPFARLLYVFGLAQACQSLSSVLSNRHSNVTGLWLSAPVKRKTATLSVLGSSGASRMRRVRRDLVAAAGAADAA